MSVLQPEIMCRLVAVATRMYLGLSLFSPLLLPVLSWRRHSESHGKKTHDVSEGEEGEKVPTSPATTAVTHG